MLCVARTYRISRAGPPGVIAFGSCRWSSCLHRGSFAPGGSRKLCRSFLLELSSRTSRRAQADPVHPQLRAYLATLRTSLVAVINSEYEAFIGLSLGLRQASVATFLATIRRPVLSIRSEVTAVKDVLEEMREEMETVLEERKAVREAKALLRRLLEVEDAVEKVEGLLKLGDGSATGRELDR